VLCVVLVISSSYCSCVSLVGLLFGVLCLFHFVVLCVCLGFLLLFSVFAILSTWSGFSDSMS